MPSEARSCAHEVLRRVSERDAYADRAFHAAAASLGPRDRALAMRISYGAVQRMGTLDETIGALAGRRLDRLDGAVLAALRAGLYELLYLDGSPDRAVVHDSVEIVKRSGSRGAGLVNAVLRRASSERGQLLSALDDSTPQDAAAAHSHPRWLAELWWEHLGPDRARSLMAANNEQGEVSVRVNTLIADPGDAAASLPVAEPAGQASLRGVHLPEALVLSGPFDVTASRLWREGAIVAQSRAAMLVCRILDPRPGERVLDLCAAPGGKSTHIAALMGGEGELVAVESHPGRARALREAVARTRTGIVSVEQADAALPRDDGRRFHRVLLDAPCSGLGTLQSHPDLRWRMSPERIETLAELQGRMLAAAATAVEAGGTLVYSTCTISPAENERQIDAFLNAHPDFAVEPLQLAPTGAGDDRCPTPDRFLTTLPDIDRTAGFFIARLRRS